MPPPAVWLWVWEHGSHDGDWADRSQHVCICTKPGRELKRALGGKVSTKSSLAVRPKAIPSAMNPPLSLALAYP